MIGGTDIVIPTSAGATALGIALRVIRTRWPEAVIENALTGEMTESFDLGALGALSEVLVYHDKGAALAWERQGAVPELRDTMLHLLISTTALTIVTDDDPSLSQMDLVNAIREALRMHVLGGAKAS